VQINKYVHIDARVARPAPHCLGEGCGGNGATQWGTCVRSYVRTCVRIYAPERLASCYSVGCASESACWYITRTPPPPPRRGIHVCRVRYVVKRHNGGISENPDAESPTAGCRLETDFRPVRTRQSRLHATLQHLLNVSDGWIRIWMKRFKKDASQTGV